MKYAISNIAWNPDQDATIAQVLKKYGFNGIEIAPTKLWTNLATISQVALEQYRLFWEKQGFKIEAMQSLLFGKPELTVFDSYEIQNQTIQYIRMVVDIAAELGVKKMVFGSPKNRCVPKGMQKQLIDTFATRFFSQIADYCGKKQIFFCIEANPTLYGANYITNTAEALELVSRIHHPFFRLHLDTGIMHINNENPETVLPKALPFTVHFHCSEPHLDPVGTHNIPHPKIAALLKKYGYAEWVSIEMKQVPNDPGLQKIHQVLEYVQNNYG